MRLLKKLTFLLLTVSFINSCTIRTYTVKERSAFRETPYDIKLDSIEVEPYKANNKEKWLDVAKSIIDSTKKEIIVSDTLTLTRDYCEINDSITLEYFDYVPGEFNQTLIFFIGNSSRHTSYTEYLVQLAVKTHSRILSWNYRGYGNSNGNASFKTQFVDNQLIFNKLGVNDDRKGLIVMGYSLGSVFAADIAVKNNADKLVLLSPVSNVNDMLKHYKRQFLSGGKIILRPFIDLTVKDYMLNISNIDKVKVFSNDFFVFHAKDDTDLPYSMGQKLFENSISENKKFETVSKGAHAAAFEQENLLKVIKWINKGI